eukprot:m.161283 g.161283  ORF g.161283 m.161283 type:complete len:77 (+) comp18050_c0_seq13:1602-1832(+)
MVATVTVTSAKATAVLVDSSATGNKMQLGGLGLVFVFVLLLSLVAQLHFINTSMSSCRDVTACAVGAEVLGTLMVL